MTDILASVSVVLGAEISGFRAAMATANKDLRGLKQFAEGMKDIGASLTTYVSAPLALLGTGAVAASAKLESLRSGMTAIAQQDLAKQGVTGLGAISQAARLTSERITQLLEVAKAPGLSFEGAEQADVRLRSVGISADQSAKSIKAFANAVATTGGGADEFNRVTVQLAQLSAKGKVLSQDLRPIIEAAPAVSQALLKLYGTIDSETISASLAKQGQSSKDFIRVLTDELAKLPQVTGGLKAVYENDMDALLVASAKVGDGIAKALDLQGLGEKLGNQITALGDGFANLSPSTQKTIVIFAGLVAATGPVLVAVGTLGAALPAITAGFAAIGSAAALVGTGLAALAGPIGLVVGGVAALAAGAYYLATANSRAYDSFVEQSAATRKLTTEISPLLARYDELKAKTVLTVNEQAELKAIVEKVTATMPAAGRGLDEYGNYMGLATDKAREFIKANQELDKGIALKTLPAQQAKLADLEKQYASLIRQRDEFNRTGTIKYNADDKTGYAPGANELIAFRSQLDEVNKSLEAQRRVVNELAVAAGGDNAFRILSRAATDFNAVIPQLAANLALLNGVRVGPIEFGGGEEIKNQVGLLAALKAQLKEVQDQRDKETTVADITADNARIISLQKQIAALEGTDKASKKAADAIAKLRLELANLGKLDGLLGDTPTQLEILERRIGTLTTGLKTLVDAGVSTSSAAFRGFVRETVNLQQALDKLQASSGLSLKPVDVKSLVPQTIGDTLPADVARLLGDYAKQVKPFELPVPVKLNMQAILGGPQPFELINKELVNLGNGFKEISAAADVFGGSFDAASARIDVTRQALQNLVSRGFTVATPLVKQLSEDLKNQVAVYDINKAASAALTSGLTNLANGFLEGLGQLASGTTTLQNFGATMLGLVGKLATQLGEAIIGVGVGLLALKFAFTNPFAAIAAGAALVIVGSALGAAASSLSAVGGGASISTAVPSAPKSFGVTTPTAAPAPVTIKHEVVMVQRGSDLRGVLQIATTRSGRVVGSGG
ncbi:MAG: tape measure protein [Janthinobacterium lividum]